MTELIFDLDGRAVSISITASDTDDGSPAPEPGATRPNDERTWLLSVRWDDEHGSTFGTTAVHHGASLEDFSHQGIARIARRIARQLDRS